MRHSNSSLLGTLIVCCLVTLAFSSSEDGNQLNVENVKRIVSDGGRLDVQHVEKSVLDLPGLVKQAKFDVTGGFLKVNSASENHDLALPEIEEEGDDDDNLIKIEHLSAEHFFAYDEIDLVPSDVFDETVVFEDAGDVERHLTESTTINRRVPAIISTSIVNTTAGIARNSYGFDVPVVNVAEEIIFAVTKTGGDMDSDRKDPHSTEALGALGQSDEKNNRNDDMRDEIGRTVTRRKSSRASSPPDMDPDTVFNCRCEYPGELVYGNKQEVGNPKASRSAKSKTKSEPGSVWNVERYELVDGAYVLPRWHEACAEVVFTCPGYTLRDCRPWQYVCTTADFPVSLGGSRANGTLKPINDGRHRSLIFSADLQLVTLKGGGRSLGRTKKRSKSCEVVVLPAIHSKCASENPSNSPSAPPTPDLSSQPSTVSQMGDNSEDLGRSGKQPLLPHEEATMIPACHVFDSEDCLISGDPIKEQPSLVNCVEASLLSGCDGTSENWQVSLLTSSFDPFTDETFFVYNVTQLGGGVINHVTLSWTGNCCIRDASFFGISLDYGLDEQTCTYGVRYDMAFPESQSSGYYKLVVAGNIPITSKAATVAILGEEGVCQYKLHGPDCSKCTTKGISSAATSGSGSITGNVKSDNNYDDLGDTNLIGVLIMLFDGTMIPLATTVTDSFGNYAFDDFSPGDYVVVETNPVGYLDLYDTDGGNPNTITVSLAPNMNSTFNDFVDVPGQPIESIAPSDAPSSEGQDEERSLSTRSMEQTCISEKVVAFDDFETPKTRVGWSDVVVSNSSEFSSFLGRFSSNTPISPSKTYSVPIDAAIITIELDFYEIDGWKNTSMDLLDCGLETDCVFVYVSSERFQSVFSVTTETRGASMGRRMVSTG